MTPAVENDKAGRRTGSLASPAQWNAVWIATLVGIVVIAVVLARIVISGELDWPLVAIFAIGAALAGATVFSDISAGPEGITIKTVAQISNDTAASLAANTAAIEELRNSYAELHATVQSLSRADDGDAGRPEAAATYSDVQVRLEKVSEALRQARNAQARLEGHLETLRRAGF
jgi:uncharacterized membrane protein